MKEIAKRILKVTKAILKLFVFIYLKIVEVLKSLGDNKIVFLLILYIIMYLVQTYVISIDIYNNSCSPLLPKQSFYCSRIHVNTFLILPEIFIYGLIMMSIFSLSSLYVAKGTPFNLRPLAHIFLLYLLVRFITIQDLGYPVLSFLYSRYYLIGEYFFKISLVLLLILLSYRKGDFEILQEILGLKNNPFLEKIKAFFDIQNIVSADKKEIVKDKVVKEEKEDDFVLRITSSIKTALPGILNRILSGTNFRKISFDQEGNLKSNLLTIKTVTFEDETHVFVELNVHIDLIDSIVDLNKYDWTLGINSNGKIENFLSAKWDSKDGRNGLIIKIKEKTIDMNKTYPYPFLFETNPLIKHPLDVMIGKTRLGEDKVINLGKMPHLMVAGATGMGKSVEITDIITSLQKNILHFGNDSLHITIVDPKVVDFDMYKLLPGISVINNPDKALNRLKFFVAEMERRYSLIAEKKSGDKNIDEYNSSAKNKLSYEVIVMDEIADLMMGAKELKKEFELCIARLGQKARAAGIHLVLGTQRPDAEIITGIIKANIPSVIGFGVTNSINSRIIMDDNSLAGIKNKGECILKTLGEAVKVKSYFISKEELNKFIDYYKAESLKKNITSSSLPDISEEDNQGGFDDMEEDPEIIEKAIQVVKGANQCSTSRIQRELGLGYARAARILDILEELGIVGPHNGSKPREVFITPDQVLNPYSLIEDFPLYLSEKGVEINRLDPVYQLLSHLVHNNGYKNRDTLRDLGMNLGFTARMMENLSTSLKNNGFILFNEKQKTNVLNGELNNEYLLELYNFIISHTTK